MNRLRQILKDRRGVAFPLIIAIVLVLVMLMCCISEYFRLLIVAQGVRDAVQEAVISTVNDNYDDVYHGVREGYSGAYQPLAGDFEESLDYGDIYGRLDDILGLTYRGGYHTQYTEDGGMEFRVWGLDVEIRNAPFASGDSAGDRFVADCEIELEVPVSFGGELLPPMRMTVKVSAGYADRIILDSIKLNLVPGSRIGLLGRNGAGKSTLIKLLAGELNPVSGEIGLAKGIKLGYFAQHQLEFLRADESPIQHLARLAPQEMEQKLRDYLGGFGFQGDKVTENTERFSGGEKARLVLALIVFCIAAFAVPLLLDRRAGLVQAVMASVKAVFTSPGTLLLWAAVLGATGIVAALCPPLLLPGLPWLRCWLTPSVPSSCFAC